MLYGYHNLPVIDLIEFFEPRELELFFILIFNLNSLQHLAVKELVT